MRKASAKPSSYLYHVVFCFVMLLVSSSRLALYCSRLAISHISPLTRHLSLLPQPSLAAFSLSFIVASPSFVAIPHLSLSPICSKETEVGLLPTMDLYSVTRSFTSHSSTNLPAVYFAGYASVLCFFHPIMVLFLQDPWLQVCRLCALQFAGSFPFSLWILVI